MEWPLGFLLADCSHVFFEPFDAKGKTSQEQEQTDELEVRRTAPKSRHRAKAMLSGSAIGHKSVLWQCYRSLAAGGTVVVILAVVVVGTFHAVIWA